MIKKGIIMAGGTGTRLYPLTISLNKHFLPIYDKPMIFYSLSTLLIAGVKEILIVTNPNDMESFQNLLKDGSQLGISISYTSQDKANGIADVFNYCEDFVNKQKFFLILGDNIFFGSYLSKYFQEAIKLNDPALIFSYHISNPKDYGVIEYGDKNKSKIIKIHEKPKNFISNDVVTGLYIYDSSVFSIFKDIEPSKRGEYEITDINNIYAKNYLLKNIKLGRGITWIDAGTFQNLLSISSIVSNIQNRQGRLVCSPEEIAYRQGYIKKMKVNKNLNEYYKLLNEIYDE